jgi:very-short-patch-repair endonuclease
MTDASLQRKLRNWQMLLLDLTRANRLLYFKTERGSSVPITAPAPADLFQLLVTQGKPLKFPAADQSAVFEEEADETSQPVAVESAQPAGVEALAGTVNESPAEASIPGSNVTHDTLHVPADQSTGSMSAPAEAGSNGTVPRPHDNNILASSLSDAKLTRALYNLRARARSAAEEQGVNVLFAAFGMLHWIDPETKDEVQSPVVLVPVQLEKERGRDAYSLELLEDDILLNPTLTYKLKTEFDLNLPPLPGTFEETGVAAYVEQVRALVAKQPGWSLSGDVVLGVFSFQKINLYQDMAEHEDLYAAHPIIAALAGGAPLPPPPPTLLATELDDRVPPSNSFQVVDADSSQQEAIEAAKAGVSFVMQGPPGTGKSQTITNIIAEMLAAGKRVLFVSQKMAALEVVQHRLNQAGLGDFCLQLHSHKRDKREVVKELIDSLDAPDVHVKPEYQTVLLELEQTRQQLNAYVKALHSPRFALHRSVFEAYAEIAHQPPALDVAFDVGDVTSVAASKLAQRMQLLDRFEAMAEVIDRFQRHPWRGITLRSVSFAQREQITQTLNSLIDLLPQYANRMRSLAATCNLRAPINLGEARPLLDLLKDNDPRLFTLDLAELQQRFEHDYSNTLRLLKGSYRAELKELDEINRPEEKLDYDEAVALLKQAQLVKQQLSGEPAHADRVTDVRSLVQETMTIRDRLDQVCAALKETYGGDWPLVGQQPFDQAEFAALPDWLIVRRNSLDQLETYTALLRLSDEASTLGLGSFGKAALTAALPAQQWRDVYLLHFWRAFVDAAAQVDEVLRHFDSLSREALIVRFRELDRQQLLLNRARIKALMSERRPNNTWVSADSAEAAILRREGAKKRRLKPLRQLLAEIPRLITDVKPCLMMSPLSVATLIDPHVFRFDLVIFDEASQVAPEEAAGAIMRGAQVIIGGDTKQLPPTRFFSVIGSDDADATSEEEGRVFESILDESSGLNMPQKMLRWHYRSRDEELIAFSNHHFYADRLFTFPNVQQDGNELGVEFVHVPAGVYRRGQNLRRNDVEAQRVVDLVFEHAQQTPDQTLGVIAFSYAQRDAITAEWEKRRREQPQFEAFFDENVPEPFFIKNLEMVQGDERDVIFFSVGYGKDDTGKVLMNFGPLNQDGGERRLNVAVTRARRSVKLISSIMPEDIDLTRTQSLGAKLLRDYMFYARDGVQTLKHSAQRATQPEAGEWRDRNEGQSKSAMSQMASHPLTTPLAASAQDASTPFEDAVYQALTAQGLTLHKQVGVSNYRIDLGVVDPQRPGRYLLGIECDGAMYYSAPTARERDRLRQQVLEQLGWKIHRIWSHDWISNQAAEIEKVKARLNEPAAPPPAPVVEAAAQPEQPKTAEMFLAETQTPEEVKGLPTYVWPYLYAKLPQHTGALSQAVPHDLVDDVIKIVGTEGPAHVAVVYNRIGAAWNVSRVTAKAKQLIDTAIGIAVHDKRIEQRGDFLWPIGLAAPVVRAPKEGDKARAIEQIAPEEIAEAAFLCVQEARSLSEADLISQTAKLLGYARVTKKIDAAVTAAIEMLKTSGRIKEEEGLVRVA